MTLPQVALMSDRPGCLLSCRPRTVLPVATMGMPASDS